MSGGLRVFLAGDLPAAHRDRLAAIIARFSPVYPRFRWVKPDNLHLTLHFLGNISEQEAAALGKRLGPLFGNSLAIPVGLGEAGAFPGPHNPAVLWVSLRGDISRLRELRQSAAAIIQGAGLAVDRKPFHPHITLARIPPEARAQAQTGLNAVRACFDSLPALTDSASAELLPIPSVTLLSSLLTRSGPVYTPLAFWKTNVTAVKNRG